MEKIAREKELEKGQLEKTEKTSKTLDK